VVVDNRNEVRDFLASRRARITPEQAGLPAYGGNRRVLGLRREEVALLAGVSIDYYTRLERGNLNGVSDSVLEALADALQLDEAERAAIAFGAGRRSLSGHGRAPRRQSTAASVGTRRKGINQWSTDVSAARACESAGLRSVA
jgi:transcriptional regulator with XRE-family HTH domain